MMSVSEKEGLGIKGIVADIYSYPIYALIDIVLLVSILHFYKPDRQKETDFLTRIMSEIKISGVLCFIVWKSKKIDAELV